MRPQNRAYRPDESVDLRRSATLQDYLGRPRDLDHDRRYSTSLEDADTDGWHTPSVDPAQLSEAYELMGRLPRALRLTWLLYEKSQLTQQQIAEILRIDQGAVSHRLQDIKKRLRILKSKPRTPPYEDLVRWLGEPVAEIVHLMLDVTSSQIETARRLTTQRGRAYTQTVVRYALHRAEADLRKYSQESSRPPDDLASINRCLKWLEYWRELHGSYRLMTKGSGKVRDHG